MSDPMHAAGSLGEELARRHMLLRAGLRAADGDGLIATREGAVTYLTGYTTATWSNHSRPIVAVLTTGTLDVVCAETEADAVRDRVPGVTVHPYVELRPAASLPGLPDGVIQFTPHALEVLTAVLDERDVRRAGVDALGAAHPPVSRIVDFLPERIARFDASALVWSARLRKSAWEIERMRGACDILDRAFGELRRALKPGMNEREIHNVLAAASFANGAHRLGYTMVVAGVDRGLFGGPTERRWQKGDVLFVDGGVVVDGYWADFCRMYTVGTPSAGQRDDYARAAHALDSALAVDAIPTAGSLGGAIGSALGLPPGGVGFGRFGHGIGLYMPEPPSLHPDDPTALDDGVVLCVEPAFLGATGNYVIEEEYVVGNGRLDPISPEAPRSLLEI
ncbi:MAG: aminopeptidase P family protein [Chloroflexia bacterium]|nr:aminopeptidase P family protein [Chloroflexia bacterium]